MINNYEQNIIKMQGQVNELSKLVSYDWQNDEIHKVEEKVFRLVLKIGKTALSAFIEKKGTGENAYGDTVSNHSIKKWDYISIFGTVQINRAYFREQGKGRGVFPVAEEHNLPEKHYSYLLQNWNQLLAVDGNFDSARETLERILGICIWTKQSEEINRNAANSVIEFYESNPEPEQRQPILVAELDGKGVIIRKEPQGEKTDHHLRLKKGEKNGKKKMATVTAVFGIEKNIRDVDDIIKYEADNSERNPLKSKLNIVVDNGPKPENKIVRATLEGKDKAFERIVKDVESRDPGMNCERVLLMALSVR